LRFDQRDAGASRDSKTIYSIGDLAEDASALINSLGFPKVHVFGIATGGMIAQELASRFPQTVDRLILGATALRGSANDNARSKLAFYLGGALGNEDPRVRDAAELFYSRGSPSFRAELIDSLLAIRQLRDEEKRARRIRAVQSFNMMNHMSNIEASTLVLAAREDQLVQPADSWALAQRIPRANFLMLSDLGHHFYRQAPRLTVQIAKHFLNGNAESIR
jgi:3-oxoadipate enol-lactonase